jgi:hypothetical protein
MGKVQKEKEVIVSGVVQQYLGNGSLYGYRYIKPIA